MGVFIEDSKNASTWKPKLDSNFIWMCINLVVSRFSYNNRKKHLFYVFAHNYIEL